MPRGWYSSIFIFPRLFILHTMRINLSNSKQAAVCGCMTSIPVKYFSCKMRTVLTLSLLNNLIWQQVINKYYLFTSLYFYIQMCLPPLVINCYYAFCNKEKINLKMLFLQCMKRTRFTFAIRPILLLINFNFWVNITVQVLIGLTFLRDWIYS